MLAISRLFGKSPFAPLRAHMNKVADCIEKLNEIFHAFKEGDQERVAKIALEISECEHAADLTKNNIRNHLPKGLFLPVDRGNILDILSLQDNIADVAEDIAVLLTLREIKMEKSLEVDFSNFVDKNIESFYGVRAVIQELEELLQSSFGGFEAERVKAMVDEVAYKEHEVDIMQRKLLSELFDIADCMPYWTFFLWMRIFAGIASISNISEKLGYRVCMTLQLK